MSAATRALCSVCVANSISTKKQVKKIILNYLNEINEVLTIRTIWVHLKSILQGRVRPSINYRLIRRVIIMK